MSFNDPAFVEIYEQIDGSRTVDLEFYQNVAKSADGPVLEAGCGSGRVLLALLSDGVEVSGFDPSVAMLAELEKRAEAAGLKANVWQGDFMSIDGKYAAIISPFNTIMHLLNAQQQIDTFKNIYESLEAGGTFAFDIVNPHTLDIYDDRRQFESSFMEVKTGKMFEIWRRFEHDAISQRAKYHREFISEGKTVESTIEFRWSYPSEIELLLRSSGFSSYEVFGDFDRFPLLAESTSQIWVAKK
jgi:SAM-dependent methyltransferase